MHQLEIKVLNIIEARCNHEVHNSLLAFLSVVVLFVFKTLAVGAVCLQISKDEYCY